MGLQPSLCHFWDLYLWQGACAWCLRSDLDWQSLSDGTKDAAASKKLQNTLKSSSWPQTHLLLSEKPTSKQDRPLKYLPIIHQSAWVTLCLNLGGYYHSWKPFSVCSRIQFSAPGAGSLSGFLFPLSHLADQGLLTAIINFMSHWPDLIKQGEKSGLFMPQLWFVDQKSLQRDQHFGACCQINVNNYHNRVQNVYACSQPWKKINVNVYCRKVLNKRVIHLDDFPIPLTSPTAVFILHVMPVVYGA